MVEGRRRSYIYRKISAQMGLKLSNFGACRALRPPPPQEYSWYSFRLEADIPRARISLHFICEMFAILSNSTMELKFVCNFKDPSCKNPNTCNK
jgi:hypothetical protein